MAHFTRLYRSLKTTFREEQINNRDVIYFYIIAIFDHLEAERDIEPPTLRNYRTRSSRSLHFLAVAHVISVSPCQNYSQRHQVRMHPSGSSGLTCVFQAFVETRVNEFPQIIREPPTQRPLACKTRQEKGRRAHEKPTVGKRACEAYSSLHLLFECSHITLC